MNRIEFNPAASAVTGGAGVCHFLQGDKCGTVGKRCAANGSHGGKTARHLSGRDAGTV